MFAVCLVILPSKSCKHAGSSEAEVSARAGPQL